MAPVLLVALSFALMWVLFILPQQKRVRAHVALVGRLEVGDEVMTSSGVYGTITALDDEIATIEVATGTVVRFARGAVARRLAEEVVAVEVPADTADTGDTATSEP